MTIEMEITMKIDGEHVNHDIMVTQNGEEVLHDTGAHHQEARQLSRAGHRQSPDHPSS